MLSPWAFPYRDNYIKKRRAADLPRGQGVDSSRAALLALGVVAGDG